MKLYLGCAEPPFHPQHLQALGNPDEWTWVDFYVDHPKVKKWDATKLDEVENNSVEAIYASHLLEHFPHTQIFHILSTWFRKLAPGGKIIINVPDLLWTARQLIKLEQGVALEGYYKTLEGVHGLLSIFYGSQSHEGEYHKAGFTANSLHEHLKNVGFSDINVWVQFDAHDMRVVIGEAIKK